MPSIIGDAFPSWKSLIQARELKIQQLAAHPSLRVHVITPADFGEIDPEGRSFYNVNTPSDLETARSIEGRAKDGASS